ncbi:MAG TPA: TIR domain-containing protein [Ktedonobacteraceae bacterium]|nr:TIR domain-containing protein [Ktedonobacteraceae bacterium]
MLNASPFQQNPTREEPMLIGFMVDISLSMIKQSIHTASGISQKRFEGFMGSMNEFVDRGRILCSGESGQRIAPLFKVFAYGFGFGNAFRRLMGDTGPQVRDLLKGIEKNSTITIDQLFEHWEVYQSHIKELVSQMFGTTPMLEAFKLIQQRFLEEKEKASYTNPPILFVLSDGDPTDGTPEEILQVTKCLQESGVFIISCYITDQDIVDAKKLYGNSQAAWPEAAKLAFAYASFLPEGSSFEAYFHELGWKTEKNARMFAQVNQTEVMKEFLEVVLSPLQQWYRSSQSQLSPEVQTLPISRQSRKPVRVFVSYSHQDRKYLANDSLLGYLKGLEQEGFEFWHDQNILAGEIWNEEIRKQMALADIALVLVSQAFLNSQYCQGNEIASFIGERKRRGLVIVPIILSACNWEGYEWLRSTQFLPREGKNVESSFKSKGRREEFFLDVFKNLRAIGSHLKLL